MASSNCPTLRSILAGDMCEENFAGLGSVAYIFSKEDLVAPLEHTKQIYKMGADSFKSGKGLYKLELRPESQSITGESQKKRGGFKQTANLVIEVVNEETSDLLRSLNNLDWALIMPDGDKYQIMYLHNAQKISIDAGGLKTETGQAASDDRVTTINVNLVNCFYPNTYLEFTGDATPESLMASE